jgi:hypothetical protein
VTTEAKARPTMTIFTTMSAFKNIDHGDRSAGSEPTVGAVGADPLGSPDAGAADVCLLSTARGVGDAAEGVGALWIVGA